MSTFGKPGPRSPEDAPVSPGNLRSNPPGLPRVDMAASAEVQAWLGRLQVEDRKIGLRKKYLAGALAAGVLLLMIVLWWLHRATVGAYAVIDQIEMQQHPADQGRLQIKFRVLRPGKVYCRRTSGDVEVDVIDSFGEACQVDRPWSWVYRPGQNIDVELWHRRGLMRKVHHQSFNTVDRADIVILMDTTESMGPSISELLGKCAAFSEQLKKQALKHRFALIGFGDTSQAPWIDAQDFTDDVDQFIRRIGRVKRFKGGDFPESALDALEHALSLSYDKDAIRRFYLVTDDNYHERTQSGATAETIAARLKQHAVLLQVFSKSKFEADYAKLLGETGRFRDIGNFGNVLSQGRVLGD